LSEFVYKAIGAQPITGGPELPEVLSAWIGTVMNSFIGVLTDPPTGAPNNGPWLPDYDGIHRIASIQKSLLADGLTAITGLAPADVLQAGTELREFPFGSATAIINGETVEARTVTYRSLDFILGDDVRRHPFAMFRVAGSSAPWPGLIALENLKPR